MPLSVGDMWEEVNSQYWEKRNAGEDSDYLRGMRDGLSAALHPDDRTGELIGYAIERRAGKTQDRGYTIEKTSGGFGVLKSKFPLDQKKTYGGE